MYIIVPSRGRPRALAEVSAAVTATKFDTTFVQASLDEDDPELFDYTAVAVYPMGRVITRNKSMNEALNSQFPFLLNSDADIIGFMGDDHRPRTIGWDQKVRAALNELGTGIVYGNDLFQGRNLPTAVFMTVDIIEALGYMAPPCLKHFYLDNFWLDLGNKLQMIRYLDDVIIEHMHPEAGKGEFDAGYARVNENRERDRVAYEEYKASGGFLEDVEKVRAIQVVR